MKLTIAAQS